MWCSWRQGVFIEATEVDVVDIYISESLYVLYVCDLEFKF